ncbi:hypothetical protein [Acinetobacter sp.]|uniref:ATP-dependent DNA ligase n=1 Tax=Acinetobacter sp. TaxID=472 RepID=UPI00388D4772
MNFVDVLKECQDANGAGSKKVIQGALVKLDENGRRLMRYAMDPYKVFGVKKFDRPKHYADTDGDLDRFFIACDALAAREITGDEARRTVTSILSDFTKETASFLERVLDKDPRAGFSADTFNKVWPKDRIPTFEVMLADKCEDAEEFEQYITFPCQADFKYDGQRTIAIVKESQPVEYRARSGKESEHLNGLFDDELLAIRASIGYDFIMDGEAFASNFTETINAKKSGNDAAKGNMKLRAFFMMPLNEWIAQKTDITMKQNREVLADLLTDTKKVILSEGRIVTDYKDMMEYCNHVIDVHNQEGLILKQLDAVYTWDRSMAWCKVKRFYPADARILGFYYGRPKSRLEKTIGGAIVAGWTEDKVFFVTAVGSGFRDKPSDDSPMPLRHEILADLRSFVGKTAVLSFQEVSTSKSKAIASLRFPTITDIRDDKIVEIPDDIDLEFIFKGRNMIPM